jgi:hypothetical protein
MPAIKVNYRTVRNYPNAYLPLWPVLPVVPVLPYGEVIVDRQSRFYLRGLRRGGLLWEETPVLLWSDDASDYADLWEL